MDLTKQFIMSSIPAYMKSNLIDVADSFGSGTAEHFELIQGNKHGNLLRFGGLIHGISHKTRSNDYNVLRLQPPPGKIYNFSFFTPLFSGCQFLAYGPDLKHVTVEHNNWIDVDKQHLYRERLDEMREMYNNFFHLSCTKYDEGENQEDAEGRSPNYYKMDEGAFIVGRYSSEGPGPAGGWQFFVRKNINLAHGGVYRAEF